MKKILLSLLLTLVMICTLGISAFAAGEEKESVISTQGSKKEVVDSLTATLDWSQFNLSDFQIGSEIPNGLIQSVGSPIANSLVQSLGSDKYVVTTQSWVRKYDSGWNWKGSVGTPAVADASNNNTLFVDDAVYAIGVTIAIKDQDNYQWSADATVNIADPEGSTITALNSSDKTKARSFVITAGTVEDIENKIATADEEKGIYVDPTLVHKKNTQISSNIKTATGDTTKVLNDSTTTSAKKVKSPKTADEVSLEFICLLAVVAIGSLIVIKKYIKHIL